MTETTHQITVDAQGCSPCGAMQVVDKQAVIDYTRCISCGMCATKCPKHVIRDAFGIFAAALAL